MYFPQLNFTRYIAAMIVVFCHFAAVKEVMAIPFLGSLIYNANSLLSYFFVLTGFVLISSLSRNGAAPARLPIKPFWIKRLTRLYPLHWLALLLTIGLTEAQVAHDPTTFTSSLAPVKLLAHALLLQAWYPSYSFALVYNYVSWTLCVDLLLLLIAPLLYNWMVKQTTPVLVRRMGLIWAASLVVHAMCTVNGLDQNWLFYWPPAHIPEFMIGMAGALVVVRHHPALRQRSRYIHWSARCGLVLMAVLTSMSLTLLYKNSIFFAPLYLLAIISICLSTNWVSRLFCTQPCQYLGKISYNIFILQLPVAIAVLYFLKEWLHWQYRFLWPVYALVLIGVAALVYEWMEKPITAAINGFLRKQMAKYTLSASSATDAITTHELATEQSVS